MDKLLRLSWLLLLAGCAGGAPRDGGTVIAGVVSWNGVRPKDQAVAEGETSGFVLSALEEAFLVSPNAKLGNVFVYLSKAPTGIGDLSRPPDMPVSIVLKDGKCSPRVCGVRVGQRICVEVMDSFQHELIIHSVAFPDPYLDFPLILVGKHKEYVRRNVEVFASLLCMKHLAEIGYLGIVDHPYFDISHVDGTFRFPLGLPKGKYLVRATHERLGTREMEIELDGTSKEVRVNFVFKSEPKKGVAHP